MKPASLSLSLAALLLVPSAQAAWQRLSSLEKRPVDMASSSTKTASILSSKAVGQPENLLLDDVTKGSKVEAGLGEVVVGFNHQVVLELVSLVTDGAAGRVSLEASVDKHKWVPLKQAVFTTADQKVMVTFAGAQAKYLKLSFDLSKGGLLSALDAFGSDTDKDYKVQEAAPGEPSVSLNLAGGLGGGRIIYISPTPVQGDEIAMKYGKFDFPESPERYRTVVYDFGTPRTLTELGSTHSPRPVRFTAYTFEKELPEKVDWRGRKSFDPTVFDSLKPAVQVEDPKGVGQVKAKLQKSVRARYVALRWEPDFNPPGFGVEGVYLGGRGFRSPFFSGGAGGGSGGSGDNGGNGGNQFFNNPFSLSGVGASSNLPGNSNIPGASP